MISIIIPTYNEAAHIAKTIQWLKHEPELVTEIIVSDGGSLDGTLEAATTAGAIAVSSPSKGRAAQMNYGASLAKGSVLYFLHADTLPPAGFTADIIHAIRQGHGAGCFTLAFDHRHWFLQGNCWFTRFDVNAIRFGDQSLFTDKQLFKRAGGFCERHIVLEDQEIIKRLKRLGSFTIIKKPVLTSARKYLDNGIYKTQAVFFIIYFMYRLGSSQQRLLQTYRRLIRQNKL